MRVLIINMYYYPNMIGGAEHSVKLLAEGLVKRGHQVTVYTLDAIAKNEALKQETIEGVHVVRGYSKAIYERRIKKPQGSRLYSFINGVSSIYNPRSQKDIKWLIDNMHPEIIHTNNPVSISYGVWKLAQKKNIRVIHTIRDYWLLDPTTVLGRSNNLFIYFYRLYFRRLSIKYVDIVTAPSNFVIKVFENRGYFIRSLKYVVANSIALNYEVFQSAVNEKKERRESNIYYLFAGYLADTKGLKELIGSFIEIQEENVRLVICGDGPLMNFVKDCASRDKRIIIKGKLNATQMAEEYNHADVMVVPSIWDEPFGRVVIEAAQYGLPTIGSNRGGIPEIIDTLGYGVYCDPQSNQLRTELINFSNRDRIRKELDKMGNSIKKFDLQSQINEFSQIYNS